MSIETVTFQASGELAEAIQDRADVAGLNVSDYLDGLIRERVAVPEPISPTCLILAQEAFFCGERSACVSSQALVPRFNSEATPDPFVLLSRAAEGDIEAQRELADMAIELALSGQAEVDPCIALCEGLVFARLASCHGNNGDAVRVVRMLALSSILTRDDAAVDLAGEAIARLDLIVCGGSHEAEAAGELLARCSAREHPQTLEVAKDYRKRLIKSHARKSNDGTHNS